MTCVDPKRVREVWSSVSYLIASALEHGDGMTDFATVEQHVFDGSALLWLIWYGREVVAAAITSLSKANGRKYCTIVACGGTKMRRWINLLSEIETYAANEGCHSVVIYGRKGWTRVLPEYRQVAVALERKL